MQHNPHWSWCRQKSVTERVMDPVARQALAEMELPPCPCQLVTSDMRFVRLSWLLDEGNDLHNLQRMQELPKEAFIPIDDMKYAYFISHRWSAALRPSCEGLVRPLAHSTGANRRKLP